MVRPKAYAVLRSMTNSNCVGCSIDRPAGVAPETVDSCGGDQQTWHPLSAPCPRADQAPSNQQWSVLTDTYKSSSSTPAGAGGWTCNSG